VIYIRQTYCLSDPVTSPHATAQRLFGTVDVVSNALNGSSGVGGLDGLGVVADHNAGGSPDNDSALLALEVEIHQYLCTVNDCPTTKLNGTRDVPSCHKDYGHQP